jgi:AcrR family transcriptional regulator
MNLLRFGFEKYRIWVHTLAVRPPKLTTPRSKGRPRSFDADRALDSAMRVFWKHGYEGASLPALTEAMGINRPSLYATFGNKESLFLKALDRYFERPASYFSQALERPKARQVAEHLLAGALDTYCNPRNPRGCLWIQGALACSAESEPVRKELAARRQAGEAMLRERFERAIAERDLPPDANAGDLARYVTALIAGMSVQSTSGANRADLERVAYLAMQAWPAPRRR